MFIAYSEIKRDGLNEAPIRVDRGQSANSLWVTAMSLKKTALAMVRPPCGPFN